ncbi:hypothetical protein PPERSA_09083 [Pseudocohnilembus persalinus]|uniref:Uncharacterized protein n=1 Tax=Pseudocohnilembus persalinus TaxID=266149 RepID=A0A0V0Q7K3_PSEPJ|nr:hypothetical protein PPERSA_09083 [Pseudocohnilembus persalinus]|eukprot:KRW98143.1 hypothetical protein PPERSA_09083 [Pseudocohnilembus persalinus]
MNVQEIDNKGLENPMICQKNEHYHQQYVYFKFSENIDEILQCITCNQDDNQMNKKIIIDQILKFPVPKIKNFPPLKEKYNQKQIKELMVNFSKESIEKIKEQIKIEIDDYYYKIEQDLIQFLLTSKKDVIQQFNEILEYPDISRFYDTNNLIDTIKSFQNKEISLEELFNKQLQMKKYFESEQKCEILLNLEEKQQEIQLQINNLKEQLTQKTDIFKQKIIINTEKIKAIQNQIIDRTNQQPQIQQQLDQYQMQQQQNQQKIQFCKSNYFLNPKNEIEITNNNKNNKNIHIHINSSQTKIKKLVHTQNLDYTKTYHIKLKINFHQQDNQSIVFYLLNPKNQDGKWTGQNLIYVNNNSKKCGALNGISKIILGQNFSEFWKDDETILNVVFNCQKQLFQIYDDQKKGFVQNFINQDLINQDVLFDKEDFIFSIKFIQYSSSDIDLNILDVQVS